MIINQLPVSEWYGAIGDNTLADATLDRIVHNSHRPEFGGESIRKIVAREKKPEVICRRKNTDFLLVV